MILNMDQQQKHLEVRRILLDPLTWEQSSIAIARFTGCPRTTVRRIRKRMIKQGETPANPNIGGGRGGSRTQAQ